jgi:hypothetical protein
VKLWLRWTAELTHDRVFWMVLLGIIAVIVGGAIAGTEPLGP